MEWHYTLPQLPEVANQLLAALGTPHVVTLEGDLGAGKTTLVQALVTHLGSSVRATSPTFTLVQAYPSPGGPIYHLDLYRLGAPEELEALGLDELLGSGQWCFVEWPAIAQPYLAHYPVSRLTLTAEGLGEGRVLRLFN